MFWKKCCSVTAHPHLRQRLRRCGLKNAASSSAHEDAKLPTDPQCSLSSLWPWRVGGIHVSVHSRPKCRLLFWSRRSICKELCYCMKCQGIRQGTYKAELSVVHPCIVAASCLISSFFVRHGHARDVDSRCHHVQACQQGKVTKQQHHSVSCQNWPCVSSMYICAHGLDGPPSLFWRKPQLSASDLWLAYK